MAKSLRASGKKANRARLRDRVFGPVELARQERLSLRLLELAQRPKPKTEDREGNEENESKGKNASTLNAADANTMTSTAHDRQGEEMMELEGMEEGSAEDMDMDNDGATAAVSSRSIGTPLVRSASSLSQSSKRKKPIHVRKRYRKATSRLMFPAPRGKTAVGKRRKR